MFAARPNSLRAIAAGLPRLAS